MKWDNIKQKNGNVLFLILIAVALFASLSYGVSQSTRGGGDIDRELNRLDDGQFNSYTANINFAVTRLLFAGCQVDEIDYTPPQDQIAGDKQCHVFHLDGGGAYWLDLSQECTNDELAALVGVGETCGLLVYGGLFNGERLYTTISDLGTFSWGPSGVVSGASSHDDGATNTDTLVALGGYSAAEACRSLGSEWYLPSRNELTLLYQNKDDIGGFVTDSGVPEHIYFSSSERSLTNAWIVRFHNNGGLTNNPKTNTFSVRCVRK